MKKISIILLLAVLTLIWSCSKDKPSNYSEVIVQQKQNMNYQIDNFNPPRTYADLSDCYNQFVKDGVQTFNEKFGIDVNKMITYISDGNVSQVIPLFKGEQMENILWINEEYYFLISRHEEENSFGEPLRTYSRLFLLDRTDFLSGNTNVLQQDFTIENSENELKLTVNQITITPDQIYQQAATNSNPCTQWEDEWLEIFYTFLGIPLPIGGDLPPDVIPFSVMEEIVVTATGGECVCPRVCLVIEALNANDNVKNSMKDLVNNNWVMLEYELDIFTVDDIESDLLSELVFFNCNPNNIIDVCTGDIIYSSTIINSMLNSGGPYTLEDFYYELGKENYILLDNSFSDNAKLNCIWEIIVNSNNDLMCSTLANFFGATKINLNLYVQNLNGQHGFTTILDKGGFAISIDEDYITEACPIEILKTLLHEAIHAEILRRHNTYTLDELDLMYPEMTSYLNDPNVSDYHHEYMANEWFDELLSAVISFYPVGYTFEEYQSIVWSGLHDTDAFDENSNMTTVELNEIINSMRQNCDKSCD